MKAGSRARALGKEPETDEVHPAKRRGEVAAMLARFVPRADIARAISKKYGVTTVEVKEDIGLVLREWREQQNEDVGIYRGRQVATLEQTILEAWKAWNVPVKRFDPSLNEGEGGWYFDATPEPRLLEVIRKSVMSLATLTGTRRPILVSVDYDSQVKRIAREEGLPEVEVRAMLAAITSEQGEEIEDEPDA